MRKKTFEQYAAEVQDIYGQRMYVIPGQEYLGDRSKLWHYCKIHKKAYLASPNKVLDKTKRTQCRNCRRDYTKARQYEKTISFVGQTTADGHLILEHVGYHATPSAIKKGKQGAALYRYKCVCCGDTEAVARGDHLKIPGHTPNCAKCRTKYESIETYLKNKERGKVPCQLYVSSVYFGDYLKIGISKDYDKRSAAGNSGNFYYDKNLTPEQHYRAGNIDLSYEDCYFLSDWYPRSWIYAIEQILLAGTREFIPQDPLPIEMLEVLWVGQSELRIWQLEPKVIEVAFHQLIAEIEAEPDKERGWIEVYKRHIYKLKIDPALCPYMPIRH